MFRNATCSATDDSQSREGQGLLLVSIRRLAPLPAVCLMAMLAIPVSARAAEPPPPVCSVAQGQLFIDSGRYKDAVREFTCVIAAMPTTVEGYRGRIEALLLLGRYSDALRDYGRVTAVVLPVDPDAANTILSGYAARLAVAPQDIPALTGSSFARWWLFQYAQAIQLLNDLLAVQPGNVYGNLFRGSSRLLRGATPPQGVTDLETALFLAPQSADVRFIVADAYTYSPNQADPHRAFLEASAALSGGLDTPRVHAILGASYNAFGALVAAGTHIQRHIDLVTAERLTTAPMAPGTSMTLPLVPGRTYDVPLDVVAGEPVSVTTSSKDYWDTILVLIGPDGSPVLGSDDASNYFAAFTWTPGTTGTYRIRVTFFESNNFGDLLVKRK
jgi:hypothetical protein